jgi:hypothetical protein
VTRYTSSCTVCDHEQHEEIDAQLRAGVPQTTVAGVFELGAASVGRHVRNGHVPPGPSADVPVAVPRGRGRSRGRGVVRSDSSDPVGMAREIIEELRAVDVSKLPPSARSGHYAEMRKALETLHRLDPKTAEPTIVSMHDVEGLPEFLEILADVLEPHVAIRRELYKRLDAAGLDGVLG